MRRLCIVGKCIFHNKLYRFPGKTAQFQPRRGFVLLARRLQSRANSVTKLLVNNIVQGLIAQVTPQVLQKKLRLAFL